MKKIALFGEIIVDTWPIWVVVLSLTIVLAINVFGPKTVVLDEKAFKCISTSPDGIGSKCDVYERRVK